MKNIIFENEIVVNALNNKTFKASCGLYKDLLVNKYVRDLLNCEITIYTFENEKGYIRRNTNLYKQLKNEIIANNKDCIIKDYNYKSIRGIEVIKIY